LPWRTFETKPTSMLPEHECFMRLAIEQAERARGNTGDNPWVGSVIVSANGELIATGYTRGPGEDHAEIVALEEAALHGACIAETTLYSTLEPCAFHGRTPACAHAIVRAGVRRVAVGILDPNPRVDGEGLRILRDAGVEVIMDVCAREITRQLAPWIFRFHPAEPLRRFHALHAKTASRDETIQLVCDHYGIDPSAGEELARRAFDERMTLV
jgi:diaminohydroxyphosphoribosylaminopyrimidine deaminase/5-amino-6-(5-phosphoribosylamino)uracil reductase